MVLLDPGSSPGVTGRDVIRENGSDLRRLRLAEREKMSGFSAVGAAFGTPTYGAKDVETTGVSTYKN